MTYNQIIKRKIKTKLIKFLYNIYKQYYYITTLIKILYH